MFCILSYFLRYTTFFRSQVCASAKCKAANFFIVAATNDTLSYKHFHSRCLFMTNFNFSRYLVGYRSVVGFKSKVFTKNVLMKGPRALLHT